MTCQFVPVRDREEADAYLDDLANRNSTVEAIHRVPGQCARRLDRWSSAKFWPIQELDNLEKRETRFEQLISRAAVCTADVGRF